MTPKSCALSRNCPEACPILDRFDVRFPQTKPNDAA